MELINALIIAIALAMDSFTVSISGGAIIRKVTINKALLVGFYFGIFQFSMFLIGYFGGDILRDHIDSFDHWIALVLLFFIGGKMVIESFIKSEEKEFSLNHRVLLVLGLATSIDALGVGLSYSLLNKPYLITSIIIGFAALGFSIIGVYLGKTLKELLQKKAELAGGIILILIGLNIAIEHGAIRF